MFIFSGNRLREMRWEGKRQEDCLDWGMRNECMDEGWADNGGDNDRGRWIKGASHSRFPRLGSVGEERDDSDRGRGTVDFEVHREAEEVVAGGESEMTQLIKMIEKKFEVFEKSLR